VDSEIAYLLGLSLLTSGQAQAAAVHFATVQKLGGPLQSKALERLKQIRQISSEGGREDLQRFLQELSARAQIYQEQLKTSVSVAPTINNTGASMEYAGSESCRSCHPEQHHSWQETGMKRMFRAYEPANVIGDFRAKEPFYAGDRFVWTGTRLESTQGESRFAYARMIKDKGKHFFEIKSANGSWTRYPVDYTIGSKWQQAYATRLPNGQIHVFPLQYNLLHKRWLNFWQIIDPEGSARADVRTFEKFGLNTSYQANCAVCHTSHCGIQKAGASRPIISNPASQASTAKCVMDHPVAMPAPFVPDD